MALSVEAQPANATLADTMTARLVRIAFIAFSIRTRAGDLARERARSFIKYRLGPRRCKPLAERRLSSTDLSLMQPSPAVTLVATTSIQMMVALAALSVPSIAPAVAAATAQPTSMVGAYISLVYVGSAGAALISGSLVQAAGALRLSQLALVLCALGLVLGLSATTPALAISAIALGLGYGPITPASSHLLARSTPADRIALTFSVKQTGVPAGVALAGIVVPALTVWLGWKAALGAVAVLCLACAAALQPLRAALDHDRDPRARLRASALLSGVRLVVASGPLRSMAALSFVYAGLQNCTSSFMVAYLVEGLGYGWIAAGIGLTVANLAGVAGRIAWGVASDRWLAARRALQALGVLMAIACVLATVGTVAIIKVVDLLVGLRVSSDQEIQGLDLSQHGEEGYAWEISA